MRVGPKGLPFFYFYKLRRRKKERKMSFQYQMGYQTFMEVLRDVPPTIVYLSIAFAVFPILLYYGFLFCAERKYRCLGAIFQAPFAIARFLELREFNARARGEVVGFYRKEEGKLTTYLGFAGMTIFALAVMTKLIFFGVVISDSMVPVLSTSDLVLFQTVDVSQVNTGDIILFTPPGAYYMVVHRVTSVADGYIRTKGDNNPYPDDWVLTKKDLNGKAVTFYGSPVMVKRLGVYFMPSKNSFLSQDPTFRTVQDTVEAMKLYGPMIIMGILLLMVLSSFEGKKRVQYRH